MSRAKFDKQEVVDAATQLFWQYGYQAVSMQDLVKGTGLKPGSLYLAFNNKEGLFAATLEAYAAQGCAQLEERFSSTEAVGKTICDLLQGMVEEATTSEYCSCFLVKAQLELAKDSESHTELLQLVQEKFAAVEAIYRTAIAREFGADNSALLASSVMMHIFGLRVYGYQNHSKQHLRDTLRLGLHWLPWDGLSSN
ncbi:MAG: TetR/AcrR family transcriptional regulator [Pseudomonadales bacterium]|nr:TetR/AcrR family transcriptional regulator [Pseudomonadales bacterium]